MEFVIDANIILSALIATEGKTFALIYNDHFKLFPLTFYNIFLKSSMLKSMSLIIELTIFGCKFFPV